MLIIGIDQITVEVKMRAQDPAFRFLLLLLIFGVQGCTVHLKNVTPEEFPYIGWKHHPSDTYFTTTYDKLRALESDPAHRFLLEVKRENVSNVAPKVHFNGTYHNMVHLGSDLWAYESENECQQSYEYFFKVNYNAGLYGSKTKFSGSTAEPFNAEVSHYGSLTYFSPTSGSMSGVIHDGSSQGTLSFHSAGPNAIIARKIVIQNLRTSPATIHSIDLPNGVPDNAHFSIADLPQLPIVLACGEKFAFSVKWDPPDPALSNGRLDIIGNNNQWHPVIILKGEPGAI